MISEKPSKANQILFTLFFLAMLALVFFTFSSSCAEAIEKGALHC